VITLFLAFTLGPYVQAVSPDAATVLWEGSGGEVVVRGPGGFEGRATATASDGMARARLEGLKPGGVYTYEVRAGELSAKGRFTTPPQPGRPFTFVVYGDNRTDHQAHAAVTQAIRIAAPDVLINTGDLVGFGGAVDQWRQFFTIERALLRESVLYPVLGNHEIIQDPHGQQFRRYFELPGNELYYAFTWGNVRFVAIDGEVNVSGGFGPDPAQRAWLLKALETARDDPAIDHVVGFVHKGPFSSHPVRTGNAGLRKVLPELQAAGLTLLVSGHDHFYERGTSAGGLSYFVLGSGGAPLYPTIGPGHHQGYTASVSRSIHAYARFRVDGRALRGCAVDLGGVPFDCFTLNSK